MARKKQRRKPKSEQRKTTSRWTRMWENLQNRTQHFVCLVFLLLVAFGFFAPIHLSGKKLVGSDTVNFEAMAHAMLEYQDKTGKQALWDPNAFGGMPGFMIYYPTVIPQLDDIPRLLRKVIWPTSHFIFLLLGTYLLVVLLTSDKLAGVFAACAYGLTTYLPVLLVAGHNTKFIALCFAPWMVLAFVYVLQRPGLLSGLLFAAAVGINLRAGHVQITYFFAFVLGIWWIIEGISAVREKRLKAFACATAWMALGGMLALMLVAQPFLANIEYKAFSTRGSSTGGTVGGLDWQYAMGWSQGWAELLTLAVANAFGGAANYWGPKPFTGGPHYVGGIVLAFAALALFRSRRRAVWALGSAGFLMTLFSVGEHFPALNRFMFNYFPLFDAFRVPETWLSAVAFVLAVLAAIGLFDVVRKDIQSATEREKTWAIYSVFGVALLFVVVLLLSRDVFFDFQKPGEREQLVEQLVRRNKVAPNDPRVVMSVDQYLSKARSARTKAFDGDAKRTLLFLFLASLLLVAYRTGRLPGWAIQVGIILLVTIDLGGVGRRFLNDDRLKDPGGMAQQVPTLAFDKFITMEVQESGGPGHFRTLSLLRDPTTNARPAYFYETLSGYHGAKLRLYQDYLDHMLFDPSGMISRNALSLMNTRYVAAFGSIPGYKVAYKDNRVTVLENPYAVARGFFVGEAEVIASSKDTWSRIQSSDFDPRRTAILTDSAQVVSAPIDSSSTVTAKLSAYSPRKISWDVDTDTTRLFVASEVYYPKGWRAMVDGIETPIYRTDYLLRAIKVPAGRHKITMRFDPRSHTIGIWVAGIATLFVYGGILFLLWEAYRRRGVENFSGEEVDA